MKKNTCPLLLCLFLGFIVLCPYEAISQASPACNNWLGLPSQPSAVEIGELNIPGNHLTVEAAFNRTTPYTGGELYAGDLVSKHNSPSDVNYLLRPNTAEITTTNGYFRTPDICPIDLNKTYQAAMTYDGSTLKFYRDGFLMSQVPASGDLIQNAWPARIGFFYAQVINTNLIGYINEVRIWNVVRTQAQIQAYMNTSLPSPATQTGLLAYYSFNSLLNQQGNPAWNGTLIGSAAIAQSNPTCANFVADSCDALSCPSLQGTLTGSSICTGSTQGFLTFHTAATTGPFTLTYTDGVNTYTQTNAQNGVPFAVPATPTTTTTYTLLSIQDATDCPATNVAGVTAAITTGNCSLCTGSLGDPVVNITFGDGNNPGQPIPSIVPGASTTLQYVAVTGNPANPTPLDGQYTITNNVPYNPAWFSGGTDHTPNDPNGYMAFYNSNAQPGEFYSQTVSNLCGATTYQFAAWIANVLNPAALIGVNPDITFLIEQTDGTVLASYDTGPVTQNNVLTWIQYGFFFTTPVNVSTVVIKMINNSPGGINNPGNDLAIDDITFRACGPTTTASFTASAATDSIAVCEGMDTILYGAISSGYVNPGYTWQLSLDSGQTWTDIPNSNSLQLGISTSVTGIGRKYMYRLSSADMNNINSAGCRVVSNLLILTILPLPLADFSFSQNTCDPAQVTFAGVPQPGATYDWIINGFDNSGSSSTFNYQSGAWGNYTIKLKVTQSVGCSDSTTKGIALQLTPAAIISTPDTLICFGTGAPLRTLPALDFCWSPTTYLDNPAAANPTATPPVTTKYYFMAKTTGANLITNGNFEAGNTGFTSGYTYVTNNFPAQQYFVGPSPHDWNPGAPVNCGDHTTGSGNMLMANGATTANIPVWTTQVAVTPNTNYAFSTWIQSLSSPSPAVLQFTINGNALGNTVNASSSPCSWSQFYMTWNSGNNTTATISLVDQNISFSGNDFAIDDVVFAPLNMQIDSVTISVQKPTITASPNTIICPGASTQLQASGAGSYLWSPSAGLSDTTIGNPVASPSVTTNYIVTGTSALGCIASSSVTVSLFPPLISIDPDTSICRGSGAQLYAGGGTAYSWSPARYLDNPASPDPIAHPDTTTRFLLTITDNNNCIETDSVLVAIRPAPVFQAPPSGYTVCKGFAVALAGGNSNLDIYAWTPAGPLNDPSAATPLAGPDSTTTFTLTISDPVCIGYDSTFQVLVTVIPSPVVIARKLNDIDCAIHMAQLTVTGASSYAWTPAAGLSDSLAPNPIATIDSTTTFIVKGTDLNGCYAYDSLTVDVKSTGTNLFVVPNAFTPNGDGHNDCFGIRRWGDVTVEEFSVYNRWGLRVFTTRNPSECWDGTYNGRPQPEGGYAYAIKARSFCGEITRTGIVMLIR